MHRALSALLATTTLLLASASYAHIQLVYPVQRHAEQKAGPCGVLNDARGNNITALEPGSTITIRWDETVQHPGHFRIMFDEDGFDDFPTPIDFTDVCTPGVDQGCLADIPDEPGVSIYSHDVTLPNIECNNCTLQVIQVMTDKPPYGDGNDIYYQCADLVLQVGAGGGPSTTSSSTGAGTSTGSGGGPNGTGGAPTGIDVGPGSEDSGCSCRIGESTHSMASGALAALALLTLSMRRRRSKS